MVPQRDVLLESLTGGCLVNVRRHAAKGKWTEGPWHLALSNSNRPNSTRQQGQSWSTPERGQIPSVVTHLQATHPSHRLASSVLARGEAKPRNGPVGEAGINRPGEASEPGRPQPETAFTQASSQSLAAPRNFKI